MCALQVAAYVQATFGGVEPCRKAILLDFFRHAFDGSGAGAAGCLLGIPGPCFGAWLVWALKIVVVRVWRSATFVARCLVVPCKNVCVCVCWRLCCRQLL
jgi:hypothetical protein